MAAKVQTRQQDYDECVSKKLPLPELIKAGPGIASTDVNTTDVRIVDGDKIGPWAKTEDEAKAGFDALYA